MKPDRSTVWLDDALAVTEPADLLPERRSGEEGRLRLPLRVRAALPLSVHLRSDSTWLLLMSDVEDALIAAPVVRAGAGLRRAQPGDGAAEDLLRVLSINPDPGPDFALIPMHPRTAAGERAIGSDQTHDSVVVGELAVVKWTVHAAAPASDVPAIDAIRHLAATGFTEVPEPVGFVTASPGGGPESVLMASASGFLPGALDGWDWCVADALAWLEASSGPNEIDAQNAGPPDSSAPAHLGGLVARMHAAFATPWAEVPEPVSMSTHDDRRHWHRRAAAALDEAVAVTDGLPGERLRMRVEPARRILASLSEGAATPMTRIHGDLHVGQMLRWSGSITETGQREPYNVVVSDFDGNPVLPPHERAEPGPPARDVAGMLRSLDHVGRIVDRRTSYAASAMVEAWIAGARTDFLSSYRSELAAHRMNHLFDATLIAPYEVEQECRELLYASRHLPRWTYVPDAALRALIPMPEPSSGDRE